VAAGDLNADGKLDLIVANLTSDTFSLLFGDGASGFLPPVSYPVGIPGGTVGAYPRAVAIGDMNADGKPDLVVAGGYGPGWVTVLLGDGTGNFAVSVNQALGNGRSSDVALGDFNGDGKKDVAVAGSDSYEIRFLLGNGAGTFSGVSHVTVTSEPTAIAAGDFNADGISDVAVTNYYFAWGLSVVLGRADANFVLNQSITTHSRPTDIAVADFNNDGKLDLANAFSWADYGIEIRFGDGSGTFGPIANTITTSFDPVTLVATDFNNDSKADLLVDISSASSVGVLLGQGNGQFAAAHYSSTLPDAALAMATGDFNQDGKLDLVTTHSGANAIAVLLGDGANAFAAPSVIVDLNLRGGKILTADFNSDGRADIAVPQSFGNYVLIYLNDAMGGVSAPAFSFIGRPAISMATGDFNHDGKADLVFGHDLTSGPSYVSVLLGNGSGGFAGPTTFNVGGTSNVPSQVIVTGNFDADSHLDLAVLLDSSFGGDTKIALLRGDGAGGFSAPVYINMAGSSGGLATADFNGDGKLDLGVAGVFPSVLTILVGDGLGGFSPGSSTPATSPGGNLRVADLNKDGRPDLISANPNATQLLLFLNSGSGFNSPTTIDTIGSPYGVAVADFNADTNPDLALNSGSLQGNVAVFSGDGLGSFGPPVYFTAGGGGDITAADLNSDGRPDLATSNYVAVMLNTFEALPCLSINDVSVTEGDAGSVNANFTVSLSSPSAQTVRVNYSLNGVTATAGADFTPVSGRLTFAPGEVTKNIPVPIPGDVLDEFDETFKVSLVSPSKAAISDQEGLGTILDNDPTPTLSVNDITLTEGGMSPNATFTVTLSAASGRTITVQYATADGTAKSALEGPDRDYASTSGTLTIPAGQTTATVGVFVYGDNTFEPDENFFLNLSNGTNATITDAQGQASIPNDDTAPTVFVQDSFVQEGNSSTQSALFIVTLSNPTYLPVTLNFVTADDSASAGSDYVATSGSITVDPGEMFKPITVPVIGDTIDEESETYFLDISNAQNATITGPRAFGLISDDDGPTVSINDVSVTEGQSGTTDATFTLTLSAASVQTVSVRATTAPGTATGNVDYSQRTSTLTFPVGTLTRTFTVPVIGDTAVESNETFFINLSNPSNLTIADGQGAGIIVNDDNTFQFGSATYSFNEGVGSGVVTVTRSAGAAGAATVDYATGDNAGLNGCTNIDGSASSRCDYETTIGTLHFAAGEIAKTISIPIIDDSYAEGGESFTVTLANASGATLNSPTVATVNINDNEAVNGANPIDQANSFVRQHYIDFLNREPDQAGLAFWSNQITECQQPGAICSAEVRRINVSAAFFLSIEFQETGYLVYRFYKSAYGNIAGTPVPVRLVEFLPDTQQIGKGVVIGQPGAEQQLEANKVAYALDFVSRSRFTTAYPTTLTPTQFVDALFANAGVTPSAADRNAAIGEFSGAGNTVDTAARGRALRRVAENSILNQQEKNRAFVLMQYFGYMRRNPNDPPEANLDFGGYNFWLGKLNQFNGNFVDAEMVKAFIVSGEYRQRFGP
jgi:hypothetical protein